MARVAGVDIPDHKKVNIALRYIYGVGPDVARRVISMAGIDPNIKAKELTEGQIARIREILEESFTVEGDLRREIQSNVKMLKDLGTYRGLRHIRRLPIKGRTHSNARTAKGGKRVAIAGKKKVSK